MKSKIPADFLKRFEIIQCPCNKCKIKKWFLQAFTERPYRLLALYVGGMSLAIYLFPFIF